MRARGGLLAFVGTTYPLLAVVGLYSAIGLVNSAAGVSHDDLVQGWEERVFGGQPARAWVRAWSRFEVVLEPFFFAVQHQIDPSEQTPVTDTPKLRDSRPLKRSGEIVGLAGESPVSFELRALGCTWKLDPKRLLTIVDTQDDFRAGGIDLRAPCAS